MSLVNTSRGLWLFDRSLVDEVQNNDFSISSGSAEFQSFQKYDLNSDSLITKYGLIFRDGISFSSDQSGTVQLGSAGYISFSMSFWWYSPSVIGYTRDTHTRNTTTKIAPLISIADTTVDSDQNKEIANDGTAEIFVYEVAHSESENSIRYEVCANNSTPTHRFESTGYLPGLHHIFISHNTVNQASVIKIYIDGKLSKDFAGPSMNITTPSGSFIKLNSSYHGPLEYKVYQDGGYISELAIRGSGVDSYSNVPNSVFNFGWEAFLDDEQYLYDYDYFGIGYSQPSTVTTNQIYSEGGSIYVARSNGDILRGESPIWDNDFNYIRESKIKNLNIRDSNKASRVAAGLRLSGTTVRI